MALTDAQLRSPAFEQKLGRLAPFVATMEVAGRLGLPGSSYQSGYSTVVPNVGGPSEILDYFYSGGQFETIRTPSPSSKSNWLGDIGKGLLGIAAPLAGVFFPQLAPALLQFSRSALSPRTSTAPILASLQDVAPVAQSPVGRPVMFEDIFDDVSGFFDTSGYDVDWGGILGTGVSLATSYMQQPGGGGMAYPVADKQRGTITVPADPTYQLLKSKASSAGIPQWSVDFPSLWQFLVTKNLPARAVSSLLSFLTKWGPAALTAMWGASVVSDLLGYKATRKRRRLNPANAKALRRAARRIKSFHRLCGHTDLIKTRRRTFASCGTCKRSPCRCR